MARKDLEGVLYSVFCILLDDGARMREIYREIYIKICAENVSEIFGDAGPLTGLPGWPTPVDPPKSTTKVTQPNRAISRSAATL